MPTLQQIYRLDITPEKFIDNCSEVELQEVILLAGARLNRMETAPPPPRKELPRKELPPPALKEPPLKEPPRKEPPPARKSTWTPQDDERLRNLWDSHTGVEIAATLCQNYKYVMARASKLGLRKWPKPKKKPGAPHVRTTDTIGAETNLFINR